MKLKQFAIVNERKKTLHKEKQFELHKFIERSTKIDVDD